MTNKFINLAFILYIHSLVFYAITYVSAKPKWRYGALAALVTAWIFQSIYLFMRWHVGGHFPLANQYESLVSMSWATTLIFLMLYRKSPTIWFGFWISVINLVMLATCSFLDSSISPLVPALQSNWLLFHVAVIMMGYAALAISFIASLVYLVFYSRKPANNKANELEKFNMRTMIIGYILLTVGIILGAVWANEAWGSYWSWDPKETWSLVTWFVYTAGLHFHKARGWKQARMAWFSVVGFAFVLFTYFGVNYLMSGLHSYAN
ncbi:c-type cytochrome biogenesis protein CcsB [Elusimicrobiota bacterium]